MAVTVNISTDGVFFEQTPEGLRAVGRLDAAGNFVALPVAEQVLIQDMPGVGPVWRVDAVVDGDLPEYALDVLRANVGVAVLSGDYFTGVQGFSLGGSRVYLAAQAEFVDGAGNVMATVDVRQQPGAIVVSAPTLAEPQAVGVVVGQAQGALVAATLLGAEVPALSLAGEQLYGDAREGSEQVVPEVRPVDPEQRLRVGRRDFLSDIGSNIAANIGAGLLQPREDLFTRGLYTDYTTDAYYIDFPVAQAFRDAAAGDAAKLQELIGIFNDLSNPSLFNLEQQMLNAGSQEEALAAMQSAMVLLQNAERTIAEARARGEDAGPLAEGYIAVAAMVDAGLNDGATVQVDPVHLVTVLAYSAESMTPEEVRALLTLLPDPTEPAALRDAVALLENRDALVAQYGENPFVAFREATLAYATDRENPDAYRGWLNATQGLVDSPLWAEGGAELVATAQSVEAMVESAVALDDVLMAEAPELRDAGNGVLLELMTGTADLSDPAVVDYLTRFAETVPPEEAFALLQQFGRDSEADVLRLLVRAYEQSEDPEGFYRAVVGSGEQPGVLFRALAGEPLGIEDLQPVLPDLLRSLERGEDSGSGDMDALQRLLGVGSVSELLGLQEPLSSDQALLVAIFDHADDLSPEGKAWVAEFVGGLNFTQEPLDIQVPLDQLVRVSRDLVRSAWTPEEAAHYTQVTVGALSGLLGENADSNVQAVIGHIVGDALNSESPALSEDVAAFAATIGEGGELNIGAALAVAASWAQAGETAVERAGRAEELAALAPLVLGQVEDAGLRDAIGPLVQDVLRNAAYYSPEEIALLRQMAEGDGGFGIAQAITLADGLYLREPARDFAELPKPDGGALPERADPRLVAMADRYGVLLPDVMSAQAYAEWYEELQRKVNEEISRRVALVGQAVRDAGGSQLAMLDNLPEFLRPIAMVFVQIAESLGFVEDGSAHAAAMAMKYSDEDQAALEILDAELSGDETLPRVWVNDDLIETEEAEEATVEDAPAEVDQRAVEIELLGVLGQVASRAMDAEPALSQAEQGRLFTVDLLMSRPDLWAGLGIEVTEDGIRLPSGVLISDLSLTEGEASLQLFLLTADRRVRELNGGENPFDWAERALPANDDDALTSMAAEESLAADQFLMGEQEIAQTVVRGDYFGNDNALTVDGGLPLERANDEVDPLAGKAALERVFGRGLSEDEYVAWQAQFDGWFAWSREPGFSLDMREADFNSIEVPAVVTGRMVERGMQIAA